ncbi:hypothetical protein TW95_gp1136 [Pandoravirus inopinatum]|uniref:Uncharacterized protein n=1 Tax=Pandoravirus inopinatum TaxID=1605721 RepID=A0A0B5J7K0_9VIRU|nr:hypothetical protein TW95_gp1136 [Pandoravirus inopinatum]AJF97870.1 hypothetical protein [Pandoravirus inopinatum]
MTKGQGKKKDKEQHGQTTPALGPRPQPVDHQKSHKKARVADFSRGGRALLCHASFLHAAVCSCVRRLLPIVAERSPRAYLHSHPFCQRLTTGSVRSARSSAVANHTAAAQHNAYCH